MNKCAKFHKDCPSGKKVTLNLLSAIELSETAVFVYNFVEKPYASKQIWWHIWPTFPLNFLWNFHRRCLFTLSIPWCKKVKNDQKLKSRGPALINFRKQAKRKKKGRRAFKTWLRLSPASVARWPNSPRFSDHWWSQNSRVSNRKQYSTYIFQKKKKVASPPFYFGGKQSRMLHGTQGK